MTTSETETLKMFDEKFAVMDSRWKYSDHVNRYKDQKDFLLTQLRLARADERKKAYEELLNECNRLEEEVLPTHAEENGYYCALEDVRSFLFPESKA